MNLRGECLYCRSELSRDESGDQLPAGIYGDEEIAHYFQAVERRDKLLEYARNSANRTRVIDEEMDWFSEFENHWNTKEERLLALKMSKKCAENASKSRFSRVVLLFLCLLSIVGKTMINVDIESRQITIDEGYMARNALHYAKLLEEFEQRKEVKVTEANAGEVDTGVESLLNMLGQRLRFKDESKLEGNFSPAVIEDQKNEFLPLKLDDSVWSD